MADVQYPSSRAAFLQAASSVSLSDDMTLLAALDASGIGLWRWQRDPERLLASPAAFKYLQPFCEYDASLHAALQHALQLLAGGASSTHLRARGMRLELRLQADDGQTLRGLCRPLAEDSPDASATSERYHLNLLAAAFHNTPDPLAITRARDGELLEVNAVFEHQVGYRRAQLIGHTTSELGIWGGPEERRRMLEALTEQGSLQGFEMQLYRGDGQALLALIYATPVDLDGERCLVLTMRDITLQRRQEEALARSRERLDLALESAALGTWDWHIPTDSLYGSPRAAALHGLAEVAYHGNFAEFFSKVLLQAPDHMRETYRMLLDNGGSHYQNIYSLRLSNGELRYLENTARLYRDDEGQPLRMVGILADISERMQREQQLAASEEKFFTLFQASPDPQCLVDCIGGQLLDVSHGFARVFGWQAEQVLDIPPKQLSFWLPEETRARVAATFDNGENLTNLELSFFDRSGRSLVCMISTRHLNLGQRRCVLVTFRDISARKQAEAALRLSQEKFAKAFHASPDAISITDSVTGCYIEVNDGFCRLSGLRPEQVIGKTSTELRLWERIEQRDELLARLSRDGRVRGMEVTGRHPSGEIRVLELSADQLDIDGRACIIVSARDISELKKAQAQIQHLAYHDALTSLPNRTLLLDRLSQQIARLKRLGHHGALLFIDLDHFKHINDSLGHPVGDRVLKLITARLEASVRKEDTVARLGGDEFVVLLGELPGRRSQVTHQARQIAEQLRELLAEPMQIDGHPLQVTPSIGIALIPDHGETPADLLKRADIALYRAKDSGRNTIQLFRSTMQQAVSERLRMESELRQALLRNEFVLHFQPQVAVCDGRITGAEALLRWQHPTLGLQAPGHFIQVLEESGLIQDVGRWVIGEACRSCRRLLDDGVLDTERFTLCVNLSPRQFRDPALIEYIEQGLADSGLPARLLKLEITESTVIHNVDDAIAKMLRLKRLGLSFAMDDFGTGYSSLTYLKRLPLDMLKIDQSFVRDIPQDANDVEIVRAIIAMAKTLGLQVLAEGVEHPEQLAFLRSQDCELYQGYLFSPPVALEQFTEQLRRPVQQRGLAPRRN